VWEVFQGKTTSLGFKIRASFYRLVYPVGHTVNIAQGCHLEGRDISIGNISMLDRHVTLIGPVSIGNGCYINQGAILARGVVIEDNVGIGAYSIVIGESREPSNDPLCRMGQAAQSNQMPGTVIEQGAFIGARVTILHGVRIGSGCVIASGAVVTKNCDPNGLYAGVPAKRIKDLS
jgi:maltose O-acetyltransferase